MKTVCNYLLLAPFFFHLLATAAEPLPVAKTNSPPDLHHFGVKPIGDWQVDPVETQYLESLFANATAAIAAISPGPDAPAKQRAVDNLLRFELENFVETNAASAYAPSLHLYLGHAARMRCGYSLAMDHYRAAFDRLTGSPDPTALEIAHDASGSLAKLSALTGQIAELDALEALAGQAGPGAAAGYDWGSAKEMRGWAARHPEEAYKCGLYCLDQLGRMTQTGQFLSKNILERGSSTNGFTAADLVNIGTSAGLKVHPALLAIPNALPVPCIVHLRSDHFVFLREQRGAFYNVNDLVASGPKWLTLSDLLEEMTGCVIVSDAVPLTAGVSLTTIDLASAAKYRGRAVGFPVDHDDSPCDSCPCPPGNDGNSGSSGSSASGAAQANQVSGLHGLHPKGGGAGSGLRSRGIHVKDAVNQGQVSVGAWGGGEVGCSGCGGMAPLLRLRAVA